MDNNSFRSKLDDIDRTALIWFNFIKDRRAADLERHRRAGSVLGVHLANGQNFKRTRTVQTPIRATTHFSKDPAR
jgi:hypothetical protein